MTRARDVANLIGSGNYSSTTFTATAGQTAFTIAHTQGFVQVFMNGLLLDETVDWTSDGSAVTLTSGAAAGDEIEVVAYNTFSVGDALNQAAADTRYVNASGDTMTGNLTLGSTSTSQPILQMLSSTSGANTIHFGDAASGADSYKGYINYAHSTDQMQFAVNGAARQIIDSSGRVTMPNLPFFTAHRTTSLDITTQSTIVYDATSRNTGNHYSTSTGRFTAPVAGVYSFSVYHWHNTGTAGTAYLYFYLNNSTLLAEYRNTRGSSHSAYQRVGFIQNFYLNANDYITVQASGSNGGVLHTSSGASYSYFSGYLVG